MAETIEQLELAFPDLVAQIRNGAVASERERVGVHIRLGRRAGQLGIDLALKHITGGAVFSEEIGAEYYDCAERERLVHLRQEESDAAGAALGASRARNDPSDDTALAAEIERQMGPAA